MTTDEKPEEPVMPTAEEAAAAGEPARQAPGTVRYSFVAWILAALLGVADSVRLLIIKQQLVDRAIKENKDPNITNEQIASSYSALLWMFLIGSIVFGLLFVLFAYKAQDGVRRARMLLAVLCVITVLYYFVIFGTQLGLMSALLALTATVLLYTPKAGEYFRSRD